MQEHATKQKHDSEFVKSKERREVHLRRGLTVAKHFLMAGIGCLLGRAEMLFGTYPMGLSFLCVSRNYTWSVLIGLFCAILLGCDDPIVHLCTYIAVALLRVVGIMILEAPDEPLNLGGKLLKKLHPETPSEGIPSESESHTADEFDPASEARATSGTRFSEPLFFELSLAGVGGLIIGLYRIIGGGFRYYDLFATLFLVLLCPVLAWIYRFRTESCDRFPQYMTVLAEGALLVSIVWAFRDWQLFGWSLAAMAALGLTLYCCAHRGVYLGIGASFLCGIAYDPLYAPGFLMAALVFLMMKRLRRERTGLLLGCLCSVFWFVYVGGSEMLLTYLPAALVAGTVVTVLLRLEEHRASQAETAAADSVDEGRALRFADVRHRDSKELLRGISDALSGLSEMLYNLSDRFRRPGTLDLRRICDRSMDRFCTDCPNKKVCWGGEYGETLELVNRLISRLHTKGKVDADAFPRHMQHRCASMNAILEEINRECARVTYEMLQNNRTEIFAMDYEAAANIINDALEEDEGEYCFDTEQEQKVSEYLTDAGVRYHSVTVYGKRRRQILIRGAEIEQATVSAETMRSDLSEMCGMVLGNPLFEVEDGISTMILRAEKQLCVEGAQNNVSSDGGISGDTLTLFSNQKDYFYALINDGMGAGREAALTSNLCSVFLEKMLRAGNRAGTSLRMLNNMIRSRTADSAGETSSTVDLLELDLMTGDASFIKSGAAPSFVIRGENVHRIQSGTAPIGIIQTLDAQKTAFRLRAGDTVVMISDGILQNDLECTWLRNYLSGAGSLTPDEIVYHICLHAAGKEGHDDCSALALRIEEKKGEGET